MDLSSYKTWEKIFLVLLVVGAVVYFLIPSGGDSDSGSTPKKNENTLLVRGKEYILDRVNSPSTTTFLSYKNVDSLLKEWGVEMDSNHHAMLIEFEATNAFGGRVRKSWCIFYLNGNAVDHADGQYINKVNIREYINTMKWQGKW